MASYQVLAAPQNIGFLTGLGRGLDESAGKYADAMLKRQEDKQKKSEKQANLNKFAEAMKSGGFEPSTATMTADGNPSYSYRRKAAPKPPEDVFAKDPVRAMRQAMLSPTDAVSLGQKMGVTQPPEPLMSSTVSPVLQGLFSPRQKQMFDNTESYATPEEKQNKYVQAVRSQIGQSFAPGLPQDKAVRELFNVPTQTAEEKQAANAAPEDFASDVKSLIDDSDGDQEEFMKSLAGLASSKYADNPEALKRIDKIIKLNKSAMPKKNPADALMQRLNE